jgi:hypothetical protein
MFTFKKFLVEKIVGNTGWVYHRTKDDPEESSIVTQGIKTSINQRAMYGRGLYCCYDINEQLKPNMEQYGEYILKGKIDLNGFAILDEEVYRMANPRGDFEKHLRDIGTTITTLGYNLPYTSRTAKLIWQGCKQKGYNGIIFTGETDGKVAVVWNRRNFIPYQYTMDDGMSWIKLNPDIKSIKRPHDLEYDRDDEAINFGKTLKELSSKEVVGDIFAPSNFNRDIILKKIKKCGSVLSPNTKKFDAPNLIECNDINLKNVNEINLPKLERCENIYFHIIGKLFLPELEKADDIHISRTYEVDLPKLKHLDSIASNRCEYVNMPELLHCANGIDLPESHKINLDKLKTVGGGTVRISPYDLHLPELLECDNFESTKAAYVNLPKLSQVYGSLEFSRAYEINLPGLKFCNLLEANYATKINLMNLKEVTGEYEEVGLFLKEIEELYLPKLEKCNFIKAPNLKKLTIPKSFKDLEKIKKGLPENCEIIIMDNIQEVKVDENTTFKKYLMLKE